MTYDMYSYLKNSRSNQRKTKTPLIDCFLNPHYANDLLVGRLHYGSLATC